MRQWNWVENLNKTVQDASLATFDYGAFNCGLFAARCCDSIRQEGGAEDELLTHFTDEASARAWVKASGGIEALVTERLGEPSSKWWTARRGDLCLVDTQDGPAVGVSLGESIVVLAPKGVVYLKPDKATKCWTVD